MKADGENDIKTVEENKLVEGVEEQVTQILTAAVDAHVVGVMSLYGG